MRPFFLLITLVLTIFITTSCTDSFYACYFKEDDLKTVTLNFIENARNSLDICVYDISDKDVMDLIISKRVEGVDVRVCTDDSNLVNLGSIPVIYDSGGLMHNKYMISDNKQIWFGSTNLTPTSLEKHENNIIITEEIALIKVFQENFEQCFDKRFKTLREPVTSSVVRFSPEEDCFDMILNELSQAKQSVYIAMFAFTDNRIAHYLKILSSMGIHIKILADREWNISNIYSDVEEMSRYTILRFDGCEGLLHEKFVIIDEEILITGSYNYTASAQVKNDEFIFKTSNDYLVQRFIVHFNRMWKESL